ncbi:17103_t:CDS:1, partial [Racocetra persica]
RVLKYRQFMLQLAWNFIDDALNNDKKINKQCLNNNSTLIVGKNFKLPVIHLSGVDHYPEWRMDH